MHVTDLVRSGIHSVATSMKSGGGRASEPPVDSNESRDQSRIRVGPRTSIPNFNSISTAAALILVLSGIALGALFASNPVIADTPPDLTPEQIKADVLLNISRYIEWPSGVFIRSNSPVMLGVYGRSFLVEELKKQAKEKRVNGRQIIVRQFYWPTAPNCNVLYVANTERTRIPWILRKLEYTSVLTVSELEHFTSQGGMVHFNLEDKKVKFHINMEAVTNAQLKVSARLLNVADSIKWQAEK